MVRTKYKELPFDDIDKLYLDGGSPYSIARELNVSISMVTKYIYGPDFRVPRRSKAESQRLGTMKANQARLQKTGSMSYKTVKAGK